jgi:hypothetical protein
MTPKTILTAAALSAGLALALPASASNDPPKKQESEQAVPSIKNDTRKFCLDTYSSASRMPVKVCRTRAEWALEDVDPLALMKKNR